MKPIIETFDQFLFEGGWASKLTQSSVITPQVILKAEDFVVDFIAKFNKGRDYMLVPVTPVGSGINYKKDLKENPDKTYGDIDYLFKIQGLEESNENLKKVNADLVEFIENNDLPQIEKEETVRESKKSTAKLIVNLDSNNWYQIDVVLAFDTYVEWTEGRMSPAAGYKGFVVGGIYSSLAQILKLSISEKGVKRKTQNGRPVDFSTRKDTEEMLVTRNFKQMFLEIAKYFAKFSDLKGHKFQDYQELDNKNLTLRVICENIKKLFKDLEDMKVFKTWPEYDVKDSQDAIQKFVKDYQQRIDKNVSGAKFDKAETESARAAAKKVKMQGEAAKKEVEELMSNDI
jgi:hypothetical protein